MLKIKLPATLPGRPVINVVPRPPAFKAPTAKALKGVLANNEHYKTHKWSLTKPKGEVLAKSVTVEKAPSGGMTGNSTTAYFLKKNPDMVYFERGGSTRPQFFGPVSWKAVPKDMPFVPR